VRAGRAGDWAKPGAPRRGGKRWRQRELPSSCDGAGGAAGRRQATPASASAPAASHRATAVTGMAARGPPPKKRTGAPRRDAPVTTDRLTRPRLLSARPLAGRLLQQLVPNLVHVLHEWPGAGDRSAHAPRVTGTAERVQLLLQHAELFRRDRELPRGGRLESVDA